MDHGSLFVTHDPSDPSYTNNCCEVYHKSLKSIIRVKRPNLWAFMEFLEKNLKKHDLEYQRKKNGLEIGGRSKKDVENEEKRNRCKAKLENKECTPLQYLEEVSNTIGSQQYHNYSDTIRSSSSRVVRIQLELFLSIIAQIVWVLVQV